MRHFVAYHNTEKISRTLAQDDPLCVVANQPVEDLLGQTIWFVVGQGEPQPRYALGSVFLADQVGASTDRRFRNFARGRGHVFDPPVRLNDEPWFADFRDSMGQFAFGVHETHYEGAIAAFKQFAAAAGYEVG